MMVQTKSIKQKNRSGFLATLPGIFTALLPKFVCPICWPVYAGLLSSLGISVTHYAKYLLPVMIVFLSIALFALGFKAKQRWGYRPLYLGIIASVIILIGKFIWSSTLALCIGVGILVAASLWNAWPNKKSKLSCYACKETIKTS